MDYCGPRGIPHSEFLSWDIDDQAKALGWMAEQAQRCPGCGTAEWEWAEDRFAYVAEDHVCLGCLAKGSAEKRNADATKDNPGLQVRLVRNGGPDGNDDGPRPQDRA
jgi:hypothetical protein